MGATSAGSIQMDLEIKSDLDEDIQAEASKLADRIRKQVDGMGNDMFKNLRQSLVASLDKIADTMKASLDRTKAELQSFVERMTELIRQMSDIQMPYSKTQNQNVPQSSNVETNQTRAPPTVSIRKVRIKFDPQFDTEMFRQKYAELENMMDMYDNQIMTKQAERKTLLESFTPNISDKAAAVLDKQVMALDMQITKLQDVAARTNITLSAMDRHMESTATASEQAVTGVDGLSGSTGGLKTRIESVASKLSETSTLSAMFGNKLQLLGSAAAGVGKKLAAMGIRGIANQFKNGAKHILSFTTKLLGVDKASKKASSGMGRANMGIGRLIKSFTIFSLIFPLVSRGIMALGQNIGATLMTNSAFSKSLNQVRSNLATAFTPIFQAVMPALNALMSVLSTVTGYIAAFMSVLFGKSIASAKQATAGIYAAKDAMGAYGSSAEKAAKATEKARKTLMGFDEVNKLDDKDDNPNSGGGGGSNAPVYTPTDVNEGVVNKWVKKLKDLWKKGDYAGIGKIIGEQVNKAVKSFTKWISWSNVGAQITAFTTGFCMLFNSLVDTINWSSIGKMFGAGINTIAITIRQLLEGINWQNIGKAVANGFNGLVHNVDWDNLGRTLGAYFQARINAVYGFVTTANWAGIGKALADGVMGLANYVDWGKFGTLVGTSIQGVVSTVHNFVDNIDWRGLGSKIASSLNNFFSSVNWGEMGLTLSNAARGILNTLRKALADFDFVAIGQDIADFLCNIDWLGLLLDVGVIIARAFVGLGATIITGINQLASNIVFGFYNGIIEFFGDPLGWIKSHIVDPFINAIKDLFGIHSPSTVMIEIGGHLISGLLNGIKEGVSGLLGLIPSIFGAIGTKIGEVWGGIKENAGVAWKGIKTAVSEKWESLKEGAGKVFGGIGKKISDTWDGVKTGAGEAWKGIKSTVGSKWDDLKKGAKGIFDGIGKKISDTWGGSKKKTETEWNKINNITSVATDLMKGAVTKNSDKSSQAISKAFDDAKSKMIVSNNTMKDKATSIWDALNTAVSSKSGSIKNSVDKAFKAAKGSVDTSSGGIKKSFTGKLTDAANWVVNTMYGKMNNNARGMMNKFKSGAGAVNVKSTVQTVVKKATNWLSTLKDSAPTWGSDMMSGMSSGIRSGYNVIKSAVSGAASIVSSFLHFSRPDIGPLHEYEEWMPDMMQGLSNTLESSTPTFINRVKTLANSMSSAMQTSLQEPTIAFAGERTLEVHHEWKEDRNHKEETTMKDVVDEIKGLKQKFDEIKEAVESKDTDIYVDGDKVTKKVVDNVNKDTRKNGKCPIDM